MTAPEAHAATAPGWAWARRAYDFVRWQAPDGRKPSVCPGGTSRMGERVPIGVGIILPMAPRGRSQGPHRANPSPVGPRSTDPTAALRVTDPGIM
jgi:hypothetical protein